MAAYDRTTFGIAYPTTRGVVPPLMYLIGWLFLAEATNISSILGLVLVVSSIVIFTFQARQLSRKDVDRFIAALISGSALAGAWFFNTKGVRVMGGDINDAIGYAIWTNIHIYRAGGNVSN